MLSLRASERLDDGAPTTAEQACTTTKVALGYADHKLPPEATRHRARPGQNALRALAGSIEWLL